MIVTPLTRQGRTATGTAGEGEEYDDPAVVAVAAG